MGRNRVVSMVTKRLEISDGDWVEVRTQLNNGEYKRLESCGRKFVTVDGKVMQVIDWEVHDMERVAIYLTDWSLKGPDGKDLPLKDKDGNVSLDALRAVDVETFMEVETAILKHVLDQAKEKNASRATTLPPPAPEAQPEATSVS